MNNRLVYFHGMPGGPGEWTACAPAGLRAFAPDRNAGPQPLPADGPVTLIGFSLGAPVAIAAATALGERVERLHLVSPAGPLALGDVLDAMAGGPLFRMARDRPRLFRLVARLESLVARTAPAFLFDRLFASAAGGDRALRRDPAFRQAMAGVLRDGLGRNPAGFVAEVTAYATATAALPAITAPITIWQGSDDNWTPPAMAHALADALTSAGADVTLRLLPGCSHYSALRAALAQL